MVAPLVLSVVIAFLLLGYAAWQFGLLRQGTPSAPLLATGALLLVGATLLVVALSWRIALHVAGPLAELTTAVERLGQGETVSLPLAHRGGAIARLQQGVNDASRALANAHNRMQTQIGQASIELADRNARLEAANGARIRLLAAASHDLRQPLYALTLFSSTLRAAETDPEKVARIIHIEECVASLDHLFSELLDLSRLEAGTMHAEPVDVRLDDVFDEVSRNFRMLAESRGLRLLLRKTDSRVRSDRTMLARILNNLVSNALRYTENGGVLVGTRQRGDTVRIDVWDTGCGIDESDRQRVFEEFFQANQSPVGSGERSRGLGLGLATVQRLAELNGCRIQLASRPGRGTCVSVLVPAADSPESRQPGDDDLPFELDGLRVLAIDDEPGVLEGLRTLLRQWGCEVRVAGSDAAAREQLRDWGQAPDLVITDLQLGQARGTDVLAELAQICGDPPDAPRFGRLLVTGETRPAQIAGITAANIPVLFKPVPARRLREAMLAAVLTARVQRD